MEDTEEKVQWVFRPFLRSSPPGGRALEKSSSGRPSPSATKAAGGVGGNEQAPPRESLVLIQLLLPDDTDTFLGKDFPSSVLIRCVRAAQRHEGERNHNWR